VTATDIAPEMIELAQANAARYNVPLEVVVSDFESLPFENQFDVVIFYDCLHHAEDEVLALQSAFRALKPGGICVTLEPGSGHASSAVSVQTMKDLGVTERDMPPKRIITAATRVGFSSSQVFERPVQPIELSHRLLPRWKTSTRLIHRLIARSTPIVMYRGHFVVLHKPNT
jgi:SAM-dependent methyltransferase